MVVLVKTMLQKVQLLLKAFSIWKRQYETSFCKIIYNFQQYSVERDKQLSKAVVNVYCTFFYYMGTDTNRLSYNL